MNEIVKSIRVGAVDFFGIIIPGVLVITLCTIGFLMPILSFILDISDVNVQLETIEFNAATIILISFLIFSYVFGYILRLSSPDELDRVSAKHVIAEEEKKGIDLAKDGWPYDPENLRDKYPYFKFRDYLIKRNHEHLTRELVTWGSDADVDSKKMWDDKGLDGSPIKITKRSKSTINKMKMSVRLYCPELSGLIESKEGHIRLMSGAWAAFSFSILAVSITSGFLIGVVALFEIFKLFPGSLIAIQHYHVYLVINVLLLIIMGFSNRRIKKLFHYRRVSELFHIVQATYFAQLASLRVLSQNAPASLIAQTNTVPNGHNDAEVVSRSHKKRRTGAAG